MIFGMVCLSGLGLPSRADRFLAHHWPASDATVALWPADAPGGARGTVSIGQLDLALAAQMAARMPLEAAARAEMDAVAACPVRAAAAVDEAGAAHIAAAAAE